MPTLIAQAKLRQATRLTVVDKKISAVLTSAITITCIGEKVKLTIIDLDCISTISLTTEKLFRIGGSNYTQPGYFQRGQRYQITDLGTADYNLIADTTGVTYQVGSFFTAANSGEKIPPVTGRAMLTSNLVTSTLTCKFPTYIRIDLEALGMDSYEGQDCIMQLDEGVVIQGNYPGSEFTPNPPEASFMTFRIPKYFRSQLFSSVSSSTLVLRIKQSLATNFNTLASVTAFAQRNPGKLAALVFSLGSINAVARKTAIGVSALSSILTTVIINTRARLFNSSLNVNTAISSVYDFFRNPGLSAMPVVSAISALAIRNIGPITASLGASLSIVANFRKFVYLVKSLETVSNITITTILSKTARFTASLPTVSTIISQNTRLRVAFPEAQNVQASLSCIGNKPMIINSPGGGAEFGLYGTVNATIQWPDGTEQVVTTPGSYSYSGAVGTGLTNIRGTVTKYGPGPDNATYTHGSPSVYSFGDLPITHLDYAFRGYNFGQDHFVPAKLPTTITSLRGLLYGASQYRGRVVGDGLPPLSAGAGNFRGTSNWDTSNVTDMSFMFYSNLNNSGSQVLVSGGPAFGINNWNVSSVTTMESMFELSFIGADISVWNTSSLTNIKNIVKTQQTSLYAKLATWNVSNVTNMEGAFQEAGISGSSANPFNLSAWNTSSATNMKNMFYNSGSGDTTNMTGFSNWDVSNVTNMEGMFRSSRILGIAAGRLDSWDVSSVTNMIDMFRSTQLITNANQDLRGWCVTLIATEPSLFAGTNDAWTYRPVWGTCP